MGGWTPPPPRKRSPGHVAFRRSSFRAFAAHQPSGLAPIPPQPPPPPGTFRRQTCGSLTAADGATDAGWPVLGSSSWSAELPACRGCAPRRCLVPASGAARHTTARPLLKSYPTGRGGAGWVGLWPVGGWVSLVWGNLAQSAYPPPPLGGG